MSHPIDITTVDNTVTDNCAEQQKMTAALDTAAQLQVREAALNRGLDVGRTVNAVGDDIAAQQFTCAKVIGQIQVLDALQNFGTTGRVALLRQMKESKAYKGMKVPQADGSIKTLTTFDDFCGVMGMSRSKVDEDIRNLQVFGEAFMDSAQTIGLGYKDLRKLRALPEADRQTVLEAEQADPDALKEMIEDLAAKNAKTQEALSEAKLNQEAKDKVLASKNKALDAAQTKLAKLSTLSPDERLLQQKERERNGLKELHASGLELLGSFGKYLALARSIMDTPDISYHTKDQATALTSGMCSEIAEQLLEANIDIDFRTLAYPAELGDIPQRGDVPAEGE